MKAILLFSILLISNLAFGQYPMDGGGMGRGGRPTGNSNFGPSAPAKEEKLTFEERALNQTEVLGKKLKLSPEQFTKIGDINLKYAKSQEDFFNVVQKENLPQEIIMKKIKDFRIGSDYRKENEIKAVLSPEQFEKFLKYKKHSEFR